MSAETERGYPLTKEEIEAIRDLGFEPEETQDPPAFPVDSIFPAEAPPPLENLTFESNGSAANGSGADSSEVARVVEEELASRSGARASGDSK